MGDVEEYLLNRRSRWGSIGYGVMLAPNKLSLQSLPFYNRGRPVFGRNITKLDNR